MTLFEIKQAIHSGRRVFWNHQGYEVIYAPKISEYLIKCHGNQNIIGLTWKDGVTMNGKPSEFFTK